MEELFALFNDGSVVHTVLVVEIFFELGTAIIMFNDGFDLEVSLCELELD